MNVLAWDTWMWNEYELQKMVLVRSFVSLFRSPGGAPGTWNKPPFLTCLCPSRAMYVVPHPYPGAWSSGPCSGWAGSIHCDGDLLTPHTSAIVTYICSPLLLIHLIPKLMRIKYVIHVPSVGLQWLYNLLYQRSEHVIVALLLFHYFEIK